MRRLLVLSVCTVLVACGTDEPQPRDSVGKDIADDYQEMLGDAANIEQQVQQSKDDVDAALRAAEGNNDD